MRAVAEMLVKDVFGFRRFLHDPEFSFENKCRGWRTLCSEFIKIHPQDLDDDEDKMLEILMEACCDEVAIEFCHYDKQCLCNIKSESTGVLYCKFDKSVVCKFNHKKCKEHGH